jgi:hypothetical protein
METSTPRAQRLDRLNRRRSHGIGDGDQSNEPAAHREVNDVRPAPCNSADFAPSSPRSCFTARAISTFRAAGIINARFTGAAGGLLIANKDREPNIVAAKSCAPTRQAYLQGG